MRLPSKKLSPRFIGPFTIIEQMNPVTFKLQLPPQYRIHSTFHVSNHLFPLQQNPVPRKNLPCRSCSRMALSMQCETSWTPDAKGVASSIWWTGRATVRKNAPRYRKVTSYTRPYSSPSTENNPLALLHVLGISHGVGVLGHLERPLEGG